MVQHGPTPDPLHEALCSLVQDAVDRQCSITISEAIEFIRARLPNLASSDRFLMECIVTKALDANLAIDFDVLATDSEGRLDRWDNEGGAIKKKPTDSEVHEAKRHKDDDTDGERRRAEEVKTNNEMI